MKIVVTLALTLLVAAVACNSNKMEKVSPGLWVMPEGGAAAACEWDIDAEIPPVIVRQVLPGQTIGFGGDIDWGEGLSPKYIPAAMGATCLWFPTIVEALQHAGEYPKD